MTKVVRAEDNFGATEKRLNHFDKSMRRETFLVCAINEVLDRPPKLLRRCNP